MYDAFQKAKDKPGFKAKHEAEPVIFEAARSTLLAMQGDEKLPSLKSLQAEQQRLLEGQQRLYDERAKLKKEARIIDTMKANMDDFLKPSAEHASPSIRALDQATLHFMDNCRVVFSFTKKEISTRQGQYLFLFL